MERIVINSNCYNKTRSFVIADNEHLREIVINGEDENSTLTKVSGALKRTENKMVNTFKLQLSGYKDVI